MDAPTSGHPANDILVWYAETREVWTSAAHLARAEAALSAPERARYARFRHDEDRQMFLLGRVMARAMVGLALGVPPASWTWRGGPRGRPEIDAERCAVSFNLAHSAGIVVCALGTGTQVGVDVENRRRGDLAHALVARCCSASEQAAIAVGSEGWQDRFLRHWTLKEAYLKARGLGLTVHLPDLSFRVADGTVEVAFLGTLAGSDPNWVFDLATIDDRAFVATAAAWPHAVAPRFRRTPAPIDLLHST